jgi:hypothetical protein
MHPRRYLSGFWGIGRKLTGQKREKVQLRCRADVARATGGVRWPVPVRWKTRDMRCAAGYRRVLFAGKNCDIYNRGAGQKKSTDPPPLHLQNPRPTTPIDFLCFVCVFAKNPGRKPLAQKPIRIPVLVPPHFCFVLFRRVSQQGDFKKTTAIFLKKNTEKKNPKPVFSFFGLNHGLGWVSGRFENTQTQRTSAGLFAIWPLALALSQFLIGTISCKLDTGNLSMYSTPF